MTSHADGTGSVERSRRRGALWLAGALAAAQLIVGFALLGAYGPTWDCAQGEIPHGERYLSYLLSGDRAFLDFKDRPLEPEVRRPHLGDDFDFMPWTQSYPFAAILSAASCRVLWTGLGWVDSLRAHHLVALLFACGVLALVTAFAARRAGWLAGIGAGLALVLSPRWFADSMNNLKDVPEAFLYVGAMMAAFRALRGGGLGTWALAGALGGFALAQKPNAAFLPLHVALLWLGLLCVPPAPGEARVWLPWKGVLLTCAIGPVAYLAASPMMWQDTAQRFMEHLGFVLSVGTNPLRGDPWDGVKQTLWTTPPAVLGLAALGLFAGRIGAGTRLFLVLGVLVPVGRTALPRMVNFDGVRHFIEFYPFLCVLAGAGLAVLAEAAARIARVGDPARRCAIGAVAVAAAFASPLAAVCKTHPNGTVYYNAFAGGLAGVQARGISWATDYWGNSYWQGLHWLSAHADRNSLLIVPVAEHIARSGGPLALRSDVRFADPHVSSRETVAYVMYFTNFAFYDDLALSLEAKPALVHEVRVQSAPILKIHRIEGAEAVAAAHRLWSEAATATRLAMRLADHPERLRIHGILKRAAKVGERETLALLEPLLPPRLMDDARIAVRWWIRKG